MTQPEPNPLAPGPSATTPGPGRPLPAPDRSAGFWDAARNGRLSIQRCQQCRTYQHPPLAYCHTCMSTELDYEPVSGRGVVYSYTQVVSGPRHPYFLGVTPYLVGLVELAEQKGLLLYTNFPGEPLADLRVGAEVAVTFEQIAPETWLPQFRAARPPS